MKNLAPNITRKRLLIEGFFNTEVDSEFIKKYFTHITRELKLRMYGEPIIFSPGGEGSKENQGYDAFVPLIDSGISIYIWSSSKFFSGIFYTCKDFDVEKAIEETKNVFKMLEVETMEF